MFDTSFSYGFKGKYTTFYAVCREAKPCEPFFSRYLLFRWTDPAFKEALWRSAAPKGGN